MSLTERQSEKILALELKKSWENHVNSSENLRLYLSNLQGNLRFMIMHPQRDIKEFKDHFKEALQEDWVEGSIHFYWYTIVPFTNFAVVIEEDKKDPIVCTIVAERIFSSEPMQRSMRPFKGLTIN